MGVGGGEEGDVICFIVLVFDTEIVEVCVSEKMRDIGRNNQTACQRKRVGE